MKLNKLWTIGVFLLGGMLKGQVAVKLENVSSIRSGNSDDEQAYVSIHKPMIKNNWENGLIEQIKKEIHEYHWSARSENELLSPERVWHMKRMEMYTPGRIRWWLRSDAQKWHTTANYRRWREDLKRPGTAAYTERQIYILSNRFLPRRCYIIQFLGTRARAACWFLHVMRCALKYPDAFLDFLCQPCWYEKLPDGTARKLYPPQPWRDTYGHVNGSQAWMHQCDSLNITLNLC